MKTARAPEPLGFVDSHRRDTGYWLLAAAVIVLLPHLERYPLWLTAALAILFTWRGLMLQRGWPAPNRWLRLVLTLLLATLVFRQYGTLLGKDAGSALLAVMLALKFFELQRVRDYMLGVFLIYFLIVIGFLYSQALWLVVYLLGVFVISTATLIRLALPGSSARYTLRLSGVLLLQALPLALTMHVLFPRIQGSLWGLPQDAHAARSGLSEEMRPGSVHELSMSEEIAFRAQFADADTAPPPAQRYWRAIVHWSTDGRSWTRAGEPARPSSYEPDGPALAYSVTLEPSNKPWLPALDLPARAPAGVRVRAGFVFNTFRPTPERFQYDLLSHPRYRTGALTAGERRVVLQLPDQVSERVRALAARWRRGARDDAAVVSAALQHFRVENFSYTLEPTVLGDDPVDEFLFDTRRGFCEHYAAAFTLLMRVAGIPARVVSGYQGGEFNPAGHYYIVRQSDAHAWSEVWLEGSGWVRVDPTAAIAPERIEYGADSVRRLLEGGAALGGLSADTLRGMLALDWLGRARQRARLSWDAFDTGWRHWVLDYGRDRQRELLARLGFSDVTPGLLAGLLAVLLTVLLLAYALPGLLRPGVHDPVRRAYLNFCRKLSKAGVVRAPAEGALRFAARSAALLPECAGDIQAISRLYVGLRYGGLAVGGAQQELKMRVARFRPARRD
jgi:transglutaminase-like putative cysteine protease